MLVFAFPGMGKTTLAKKYQNVVDLEMSDIKYDNSSVSHLSKEERKSTPRPIKDKNYKQVYIQRALALHDQGKTVLVALNFLFPLLTELIRRREWDFHIYIPHPSLRKEYHGRYLKRGNNNRFIFEVMAIWYPSLLPLWLLSKLLPQTVTVAQTGQTLEDLYLKARSAISPEQRKRASIFMKMNENSQIP
ncbi:hypothetical protein ACTJ5T_03635 [Streptococcus suis]|uniref:hypothetical protein n=1 Tax=Streptococcus suis TaxID=1307 RepID=UPI003F8C0FF3